MPLFIPIHPYLHSRPPLTILDNSSDRVELGRLLRFACFALWGMENGAAASPVITGAAGSARPAS